MSEHNKQLIGRFVDACNANDPDALDEILAENFVRHCQATPDVDVTDRDAFKHFLADIVTTFPDQRGRMDTLVAEGDRVAFFGTFCGTQKGQMGPFPPSGKRLESDMAGVFRIQDGMIAELWVTWDNVAGLVQLGHLPSPGDG